MPGIYGAKPWFVGRLRPLENRLVARGTSPNSVTLAGLTAGIGCGSFLALGAVLDEPRLWLLVPPLGLARLVFNALDGSIARRTGAGSALGEVLNEMGDRISDAALIAPIAFAAGPALALGALSMTLMASTAGLLGRISTGRRISMGPMGKADRVAVVSVASAIAAVTGTNTPLVVACWLIGVGAGFTAVLRIRFLGRAMTDAG